MALASKGIDGTAAARSHVTEYSLSLIMNLEGLTKSIENTLLLLL